VVTKERFAQGMTVRAYVDQMSTNKERFLAALDGIEQGVFPPKPDEPFLCTWCGYASVCRKDYVGDE